MQSDPQMCMETGSGYAAGGGKVTPQGVECPFRPLLGFVQKYRGGLMYCGHV
jgi:hypothetical protein